MSCGSDWGGGPAPVVNMTVKRGGKFHRDLELRDQQGVAWPIPAGSSIRYVFGPDPTAPVETWPATFVGNKATIDRTIAQMETSRTLLKEGTQVRLLCTFPPDVEPDVKSVGVVMWQ